MDKHKNYVKRIIKLISLSEMKILPGHLAFNIVLMIVPIFSIIGLVVSKFNLNNIAQGLSNNVPDAVLSIIESALNLEATGYNLFLFIIFGLWLVSGSCRAIISACDVLYKVNNTSFLREYIRSFFMVIILFILITFIIVIPVFGDLIFDFLNNYFRGKEILFRTNIYHFFKYPLSIVLIFISIKLLYTIAPNVNIKSKYTNNGALFTTISWFITSRIYSYHLNNYSNYNLYYGGLSNILILLVWVYLLAYLFTIGISLNADNYLMNKEDAIKK